VCTRCELACWAGRGKRPAIACARIPGPNAKRRANKRTQAIIGSTRYGLCHSREEIAVFSVLDRVKPMLIFRRWNVHRSPLREPLAPRRWPGISRRAGEAAACTTEAAAGNGTSERLAERDEGRGPTRGASAARSIAQSLFALPLRRFFADFSLRPLQAQAPSDSRQRTLPPFPPAASLPSLSDVWFQPQQGPRRPRIAR